MLNNLEFLKLINVHLTRFEKKTKKKRNKTVSVSFQFAAVNNTSYLTRIPAKI